MKNLRPFILRFGVIFLLPLSCMAQKSGIEIMLDRDDESGEVLVSDLADFPGYGKDEIFTRALTVARENLTDENDTFDRIDFGKRRLQFVKNIDNGKGGGGKLLDKEHATYRFTVSLSPDDDGSMSYIVGDIWVSFKDKGIIGRTLPMSALKDDNIKHAAFKKEFSELLAAYLSDFFSDMKKAECGEVTHWDAMDNGDIVKGMNSFEVTLLKGKPRNVRDSGNRSKWMYSNSFVVIFTDGIVSSVVD